MPTKPVSNEDILELLQESMQMTSERFDRQEAWNEKQQAWNEKQQAWNEKQHVWNEKQQAWNEKQQAWNEKLLNEVKAMRQDLSSVIHELAELKVGVKRIANEQRAQVNDISDILDRVEDLLKKDKKNKADIDEIRSLLQEMVDWAGLAAKNLKIPLKIRMRNNNASV